MNDGEDYPNEWPEDAENGSSLRFRTWKDAEEAEASEEEEPQEEESDE